MRSAFTYFAATVAALALVWAAHVATAAQIRTGREQSARSTRACIFPNGGWTTVDCSNVAAASSAALNPWSNYIVQCGDDSYLAPGTAASGQDADSSDGYLPEGEWLRLGTTDTVLYYSCLNINSDSDCRHIECQ